MSELVQILCTRPNASELISGVRFAPGGDGMLSEPVSRATAELFGAVPGYRIVAVVAVPDVPEPAKRGRKSGVNERHDG